MASFKFIHQLKEQFEQFERDRAEREERVWIDIWYGNEEIIISIFTRDWKCLYSVISELKHIQQTSLECVLEDCLSRFEEKQQYLRSRELLEQLSVQLSVRRVRLISSYSPWVDSGSNITVMHSLDTLNVLGNYDELRFVYEPSLNIPLIPVQTMHGLRNVPIMASDLFVIDLRIGNSIGSLEIESSVENVAQIPSLRRLEQQQQRSASNRRRLMLSMGMSTMRRGNVQSRQGHYRHR